jgi:hypothetical protein
VEVVRLDNRRGGRHVRLGTQPIRRHIPSSQSALPSIGRALPVDSTRKISGAIESVRSAWGGWQLLDKFRGWMRGRVGKLAENKGRESGTWKVAYIPPLI